MSQPGVAVLLLALLALSRPTLGTGLVVPKERIWVFPPLSTWQFIWVAISLAPESTGQSLSTVSVDLIFAGWGKGCVCLVPLNEVDWPV